MHNRELHWIANDQRFAKCAEGADPHKEETNTDRVKQWNPREGLRPLSRGRRNGPGPRECSRHEPADMEESLMRVPTGASL